MKPSCDLPGCIANRKKSPCSFQQETEPGLPFVQGPHLQFPCQRAEAEVHEKVGQFWDWSRYTSVELIASQAREDNTILLRPHAGFKLFCSSDGESPRMWKSGKGPRIIVKITAVRKAHIDVATHSASKLFNFREI